MITKKQILIYIKYDGESDGFTKCATKSERSELTDDEWLLLDDIVFDLHLLNPSLASKENAKSITDKLEKHIWDKSLIKLLADFAIRK